MILYRVTSAAMAAAILARGFKDSTRRYGSQSARKGIWFSDRPLDAYADIWSDTVLSVEFECPSPNWTSSNWSRQATPFVSGLSRLHS